ncbi:hypothetical protein EIK77_002381 [Talaromyces pinophilus]|nr:hypothetical protein EIK77_002381 [Talaromyces pinophilus]
MYSFPVACFEEAIRYASTFTSVGAGTLQAMIEIFAQNDDIHFAGALASVLGQEGEQGGFYRVLQQKVPNELPFLTTGTREFLFSWLHGVISTESCPSLDMIDLPVFAPLNLITDPAPETANITFTFDSREGGTPVNPVFINQQNTPIVQPMSVLSSVGTVITAQAEFPYDEYEMNGLTIVVLTNHTGPFVDAQAVANATVFGPAFIVL